MFKLSKLFRPAAAASALTFAGWAALGTSQPLSSDAFSWRYAPRAYTQRDYHYRYRAMGRYNLRESQLPSLDVSRAASCAVLRANGQDKQVSYCKTVN